MRDILSFLTYVFLILIAFLIIWYGLRSHGINQPISSYQTPLVKKLTQLSSNKTLVWTESKITRERTLHTRFENSQWVVTNTGKSQRLDDFIKTESFTHLLLFFEVRSPKALPALQKIFAEKNLWKKTVFCSRADGILKDLRALEAEWTFCSGEIFMTRSLAMTSLKLESLIDMTADVLYIHLDNLKPSFTVNNLILEAKRKNKLVLMGPVTRPLDGFDPHGWIVKTEDQKDSH